MRHYELLVVIKPTLTEEESSARADFLKELLEKNGAEIESIDDMGIKNLAYEVKKNKRGHYFVYYFKAPASAIAEIERIIRITEDIIKFLSVKYESKKEVVFWEQLAGKAKKATEAKKAKEEPKAESKTETVTEEKAEEKSE